MNVFKKALEENRIAKVRIPLSMLQSDPDVVQLLLAPLLVFDVTPFHAYNGLEYELVHPQFDPVPEGEHAPVMGLRQCFMGNNLELLEFSEQDEIFRR